MAAVWLRFRADLRTRWRAWLVLALLVAIGTGVVLASLAGARRTDGAYSRFLATERASDVFVVSGGDNFGFANLDLGRVAREPGVADAAPVRLLTLVGVVRDKGAAPSFETIAPIVDPRGAWGRRIDRVKILEGRRPDPGRADEVAPGFLLAERLGLHVGDRLRLRFGAPGEANLLDFDPRKAHGPLVSLAVVGIGAAPYDFPPIPGYDLLRLTPAFAAQYGKQLSLSDALAVRLRAGTRGVAAFKARVERLAAGEPVQIFTQHQNAVEVERSIHLQAVALLLLAGLAGIVALLVVAQAVTRQTYLEADDDATLSALGLSRRQLSGLVAMRLALIGGVGALLAMVLAIGLSALTPIGLASKAEPDPGIAPDGLVLGVGAVLAISLVAIVGVAAALRASRAAGGGGSASARPSAFVGWLASSGAPTTAIVGVRMAITRGRGRAAVPVWSTLAGGVLAITTVVAAVGFGASLDHLLSTPRLYGVNWTVTAGDDFSPDLREVLVPALRHEPAVRAIAGGTLADFQLDGRLRVHALASQPIIGDVAPTVLEGHAPASSDEILLGTTTLDDLGKHVGSSVKVSRGDHHVRMRVVGRGVLPDFGDSGLGRGAAVTYDGWRRLAPDAPENYFLVRLTSNADPVALADRIERRVHIPGIVNHRSSAPTDLASFGRVESMPFVVAGLLALMAAAALAHTLVSQVRRRRRDLAVLKTLGFERRQISATTAWQASTLAALALLVGIPLGILVGRVAWRAFVEQLGAVDEPRIAWLPILVLIPAALALANLIAVLPARSAARTRPALVLRSE